MSGGRTLAEKILSRASGRDVHAGDLVIVPVSRVMVHDSVIDAVMAGLRDLGKERVWDPGKVCVFVDHAAPAPTPVVADSHRVLREWVRTQKIATFYDAGEGVCHQIMVEEGYCEPGTVIVGSDSHSNSYEILDPADFGLERTMNIAHRLTGYNAIGNRAEQLGLTFGKAELRQITQRIKAMADAGPLSMEQLDAVLKEWVVA